MEIDIEEIVKELGNVDDPNNYISNLKNRISSIKDNILIFQLLIRINSQQLNLITKDLDDENKNSIFSEFEILWDDATKKIKKNHKIPTNDKKNFYF